MVARIKVTDEMLSEAVASSSSFFGVLRCLGLKQAGGSHSHYKRRAEAAGIDTSHFTGQACNRGKVAATRKTASDILRLRTSGGRAKARQLTRSLLEIGVPHRCKECGQEPSWRGNPLTLDVDHINENWLDDRAENLRFLCPNCHSQFSRNLLGSVA